MGRSAWMGGSVSMAALGDCEMYVDFPGGEVSLSLSPSPPSPQHSSRSIFDPGNIACQRCDRFTYLPAFLPRYNRLIADLLPHSHYSYETPHSTMADFVGVATALLSAFVPFYSSWQTRDDSGKRASKAKKSTTATGSPIGVFNGKQVYSLEDAGYRQSWSRLEPQIENIITRTPPAAGSSSKCGSSPLVHMQSVMVEATPTIIISSSSPRYASMLRREIRESGVLNMGDVVFKIETAPGGLLNLQVMGGGSRSETGEIIT